LANGSEEIMELLLLLFVDKCFASIFFWDKKSVSHKLMDGLPDVASIGGGRSSVSLSFSVLFPVSFKRRFFVCALALTALASFGVESIFFGGGASSSEDDEESDQ
jgi:hypothetical protein